MTQFSWPWACDNLGDGGTGSYTLDVVEVTNRISRNLNPTSNGVIWWHESVVLPFSGFANACHNLLYPTNPSGNTIRIASGLGMVQGWLYANDDNVDFDASGAASATDIIVLRMDRTAQTVRLALVQAGAGGTATVTQNSTTWEVLIATIALDGSGNVNTLTDNRTLVGSTAGSLVKIASVSGNGGSATLRLSFGTGSIGAEINNYLFSGFKIIVSGGSNNASNLVQVNCQIDGDANTHYWSTTETENGSVTVVTPGSTTTIPVAQVVGTSGGIATVDLFEITLTNNYTADHIHLISRSAYTGDGSYIANGVGTWITTGKFPSSAGPTIGYIDLILAAGQWITGSSATLYGYVS